LESNSVAATLGGKRTFDVVATHGAQTEVELVPTANPVRADAVTL
jgi:hypothetical protein